MDYKRTCYSTQVRFSPGGPVSLLRWYRCHPKAKLFKDEHIGLSREWYTYREDFGEVRGTKVYDKGANTLRKKGQCYRGKLEWYRNGFTGADLAAANPQEDKCTSCPGQEVKLQLIPGLSFGLFYYLHLGAYNWYPWFIQVTVTSPDPAWAGTFALEANETTQDWTGSGTLGTSNSVTWGPCTFTADMFGGTFAYPGGSRLATILVSSYNPVAATGLNDTLLPMGPPNGTVWTISAALLVPRIVRVSRPNIKFGHGRGKRPARIKLLVLSTFLLGPPSPGGSGYDDGYSDGYGG